MGSGSWSAKDWSTYSTTHIDTAKTAAGMYTSTRLKEKLDPKHFRVREARDSVEHPNSTPIIVALDVTGSMASILDALARKLDTMITELYERRPVTDPQICFMAIGDMECDSAPVQMTQFESDIRIAEQMTEIYYERGGGGNSYESYIAAWYMAAFRTAIDSVAKHGKKGILFTIGDENPTPYLLRDKIKRFLDDEPQSEKLTAEYLLEKASKEWEIFHLITLEGNGCSYDAKVTIDKWQRLLGQLAMPVDDYTKIPEIIVSTLEILAGKDKKDILGSWDGSTALTVARAIDGLIVGNVENDIVTF